MAHALNLGARLFVPTAKTPFFARLLDTLLKSRQRHADRVVARYLAAHGNKFTDEAERDIERVLFREGGWR